MNFKPEPPPPRDHSPEIATAMHATRPCLPPALRDELEAVLTNLPQARNANRNRRIIRFVPALLATAALLLGTLFLLPTNLTEDSESADLPAEVLAWEPPQPVQLFKPRPVYTLRAGLDLRLAQLSADAESLDQALNPNPIINE